MFREDLDFWDGAIIVNNELIAISELTNANITA